MRIKSCYSGKQNHFNLKTFTRKLYKQNASLKVWYLGHMKIEWGSGQWTGIMTTMNSQARVYGTGY